MFPTTESAQALLNELHLAMQYRDTWDHPNPHPFDDRALVSWNDQHLEQYTHLVQGIPNLSREEAIAQGWTFGWMRGAFVHARQKLQEAQLLQEALENFSEYPNFPVYRALFFGFLSATYAIKEATRRTCDRFGPNANAWFEEKFQEIKSTPLLWCFYQLNNSNKHSPESIPLKSDMPRMYSVPFGGPPGTTVITSNDGVFAIANAGTPRERIHSISEYPEVHWYINLEAHEYGIISPATPLTSQVLNWYEDLVFEARTRFDRNHKPAPM